MEQWNIGIVFTVVLCFGLIVAALFLNKAKITFIYRPGANFLPSFKTSPSADVVVQIYSYEISQLQEAMEKQNKDVFSVEMLVQKCGMTELFARHFIQKLLDTGMLRCDATSDGKNTMYSFVMSDFQSLRIAA